MKLEFYDKSINAECMKCKQIVVWPTNIKLFPAVIHRCSYWQGPTMERRETREFIKEIIILNKLSYDGKIFWH